MHEARDHRLGEKVGNEAQPQQSGQQADEPDHDAEPGREQRQPRRIAQRQRRHGDRDDGRHGGVGSNDEVTGAAEQGVGEQRQHAAVETGHRKTGQFAIGEPHRHHDRAQRQSSRQIARQEGCLVAAQRREAWHPAPNVHSSLSPARSYAGQE